MDYLSLLHRHIRRLTRLVIWIPHATRTVRKRFLAFFIHISEDIERGRVQASAANQPRHVQFQLMRQWTLEMHQHLHAGAIVQCLNAARVDAEHPLGNAEHDAGIFEELSAARKALLKKTISKYPQDGPDDSHNEFGWLLQIDILHNVMVGLDIGACKTIWREIRAEYNNRSAHGIVRALEREILIRENGSLVSDV